VSDIWKARNELPLPKDFDCAVRERNAWADTCAQQARDIAYYQDLLDQCASHLGPGVFVCDDGSVATSPLRAKIPEMVRVLATRPDPS
jgi:hypothetical protein